MKVIIYIFLYLILTAAYYLALSAFGLFFTDYSSIISNPIWFGTYLALISWWLVVVSLSEYYEKHLKNILW
jgi:hypothetical protein